MQVDIQGAKRPMVEKGIPSNTNFTEAYCEISFCSLQVNIQGAKRPIVEKVICTNKNYKEAICETSYSSVHSTNRVEPQF